MAAHNIAQANQIVPPHVPEIIHVQEIIIKLGHIPQPSTVLGAQNEEDFARVEPFLGPRVYIPPWKGTTCWAPPLPWNPQWIHFIY